MCRLPFILVLLLCISPIFAQNPHGDKLNIDCDQCHNPNEWALDYDTLEFDHNTTDFKLEGSHSETVCKSCHNTLVFDETPNDCMSCHVDVHSQSVGNDCMRCHTEDNW